MTWISRPSVGPEIEVLPRRSFGSFGSLFFKVPCDPAHGWTLKKLPKAVGLHVVPLCDIANRRHPGRQFSALESLTLPLHFLNEVQYSVKLLGPLRLRLMRTSAASAQWWPIDAVSVVVRCRQTLVHREAKVWNYWPPISARHQYTFVSPLKDSGLLTAQGSEMKLDRQFNIKINGADRQLVEAAALQRDQSAAEFARETLIAVARLTLSPDLARGGDQS